MDPSPPADNEATWEETDATKVKELVTEQDTEDTDGDPCGTGPLGGGERWEGAELLNPFFFFFLDLTDFSLGAPLWDAALDFAPRVCLATGESPTTSVAEGGTTWREHEGSDDNPDPTEAGGGTVAERAPVGADKTRPLPPGDGQAAEADPPTAGSRGGEKPSTGGGPVTEPGGSSSKPGGGCTTGLWGKPGGGGGTLKGRDKDTDDRNPAGRKA